MPSAPYLPANYPPADYLPRRLIGGTAGTSAMNSSPYVPAGYLPGSYLPRELVGDELTVPIVLFGNELANYILSNLGVNAYPSKLPESNTAFPLLSYTVVAGDSDLILSGPSGSGYRMVQLDAWSPLAADVETLGERLRLLLAGSRSSPGARGTMGRLKVTNCTRGNVRSTSEFNVDFLDSATIYRFMSEFEFWFFE